MKKYFMKLSMFLGAILLLQSLLQFQPVFHAATGGVVNIPDIGLKTHLNRQLKQADDAEITDIQMETITIFQPSSDPVIADFTGIEYAKNITALYVNETTATDITPITSLSKLDSFGITGNNITTLPDMNHMTDLNLLNLNIPISSDEFTKINQLPNLRHLDVSHNMKITDITLLASLPNLASINLQFCGVTDFTVIKKFPKLNDLAAFGQKTGRYDAITQLNALELEYNQTAGTLFLPFSMMPNRLTNFDGEMSPISLSNGANSTYLAFNGGQLPAQRLEINSEGIRVLEVTREEFDALSSIRYNAAYTWAAGDYAEPEGYGFYSISSGNYLHDFTVDHSLEIIADASIVYNQNDIIAELEFFKNINAHTNDGSPITSDFLSNVDFSIPGEYVVTLNAENTLGVKAVPVQVIVIIKANAEVSTENNIIESDLNNNELPTTGQNIDVILFFGSALLSGSILFIFLSKKKKLESDCKK